MLNISRRQVIRPTIALRHYVTQTPKQHSVALNSVHPATAVKPAAPKPAVPENFLETLNGKELFSLGVIGAATLNKPILDLVIKTFPYVPMPLVKLCVYSLYCGGDNFSQVIKTGERLAERGINNMMLSLTIEDSEGTKNIDINHIVTETVKSVHEIMVPHMEAQLEKAIAAGSDINDIPPGYLALKPSALVKNPAQVLLNYNNPEFKSQWDELNNNCAKITADIFELNQKFAEKYPERTSPFFVSVIDAEKYDLQQGVYALQRNLFAKFNPIDKPVSVVGTWQLYLRDAWNEVQHELDLAAGKYRLGLKLVRGAYIHTETKRKDIIFGEKAGTDDNYNTSISTVITDLTKNGSKSPYGHLVVASHNRDSQMLATTLLAQATGVAKSNVVLGQLLGMADNVTHELINHHGVKNIIKYVPWGPPLETKDYLLRRLEENGDAVRADNGWPLIKGVFKTMVGKI